MKNIIIVLIFFYANAAHAQIRAFDNSKAVLPWVYNPAVEFNDDLQAYIGYDARGNSSFTPRSIIAGVRMPIKGAARTLGTQSVAGVQILNTSENLLNALTLNLSFAQQISLNRLIKLGFGLGAGVFNMRYKENDLVYRDLDDPFLNKGENLFNLHVNAGVSLTVNDRLFLYLSAPYLLKNDGLNAQEVIIRAGYRLSLNQDVQLITAANLDTYNRDMIYGGDIRMEWKKIVSVMAGADRYKYHGGIMLNFDSFGFGYVYGRNFNSALKHIESHQLSIIGSF